MDRLQLKPGGARRLEAARKPCNEKRREKMLACARVSPQRDSDGRERHKCRNEKCN